MALRELYRSNDPVSLSYLKSILADNGIESVTFDAAMGVMEGSIPLIQQRIMVLDQDYSTAKWLLRTSEIVQ